MRKKAPILSGVKPDMEYNLDDENDLAKLGLDPIATGKIADRYVHYRDCKYAVIEFKSSTLRKAVEQVENTVRQLLGRGKRIDYVIIVMDRLSRYEKRILKRRRKDKVLCDPVTDKPRTIKIGSRIWNILLFYSGEIRKMYSGLNRYL